MFQILLSILLCLVTAGISVAQSDKPQLLLRNPALSRTHVAFDYAGDIWIVSREGGEARRLTTGIGNEFDPLFSPDGSQIAFTGEYDGNIDVFLVPASGGVPRRLTYHPGPDFALGWTPDGKQILFRSFRSSYSPRFTRLFTMPAEGAFPAELPLPMGSEASFSPDGARLAYVPLESAFAAWKRYRGGMTTPIWIADLADSSIEKIPRDNSNDFRPMWVDHRVFFLSDRNGPVTLFAYDTKTKKVAELLRNTGLDLKSASAGPGAIVYEQFGSLHLLDLKSLKPRHLDIRLAADVLAVRPSFEKVARSLRSPQLSPTGVRALVEARGDILTVPVEKGDIRNLTNTPAVAERSPSWSPDGKRIAYFSDEAGEYQLHIADQSGLGEVQKIDLGQPPSFYYRPTWSPDSKKIAYTDARLTLWYLDLDKKTPVRVDADTYHTPMWAIQPVWSSDSRWIAYARHLKNRMGAIFVYSLESAKAQQITDGMSDARYPAFDANGQYLYFAASTNIGLTAAWLDMSAFDRPVTRSVYLAVLRKDLPSPLAPESDEEKADKPADAAAKEKEAKEKEKKDSKEPVRIDSDNISQRILALPIPARNYMDLRAGKTGILYLTEAQPLGAGFMGNSDRTVQKFDLKTRKTDKLLEGITFFTLSHNGEKMLFNQSGRMVVAAANATPKPGEGALRLDAMEVRVDPRAEWRQMYREVWRIERDFFYDPGYHGLDLRAMEKKYAPYVDAIASRADLNYLFREMLGELSVGHLFVGGGAMPDVKRVPVGLLGADYKIENGRYRFARVYNGENWNPQLRAPLTQPGVNVVAGEYLLAVNGRDLRASDNIYSFFEATSGKSVVLRVGPDSAGANSREVTVVPVAGEGGLRNLAWIEDNRRKVDQLSGGRLAYVYLPDTAGGGYTNFNRYFAAQIDKQGAVIDERFNGGGTAADYIIDHLRRPLMNYWTTRSGEDFTTPAVAIFGPKAMIINEFAGSGGDAMPWYFRKAGIGPLIGKRTWGGLVGIFGFPQLIDGGGVTAPNLAFYNTNGEWEVENRGVAPDIEVELDPNAVRAGRDPQLEKAVEVVLEALKKNPPPVRRKPAYPNYHGAPARTSTGGAANGSPR